MLINVRVSYCMNGILPAVYRQPARWAYLVYMRPRPVLAPPLLCECDATFLAIALSKYTCLYRCEE